MERLTKDDLNKVCYDPWEICGMDKHCTKGCHEEGGCTGGCHILKMYRKLAKYEDLEEQCVKDNLCGLHELCEKWKAFFEDIVELLDYRKKQEQGLLIELPVAIGEEVYCIKNMIDGYEICKNRVLSYQTAPKEIGGIVVRGYMGVALGIVGKNVFATEAEAEEALAKMGGK